MKKPREYSPTQILAFKFVKEILGREFDWRFDRRWMAEAKRICEPEEGYPISSDIVWGCLKCLQMGMFGFDKKVISLWVVTYGDPNYIEQYSKWLEIPPPFYEHDKVIVWENLTGKAAYENEICDTIVSYPPTLS